MPLTFPELQEIILLVCPHCNKGVAVRQREDNKEFVHDVRNENGVTHTICWASRLRNSHFAKDVA